MIARSVLPTAAPAVGEFFRGMRGTVHVAFEEGTQAQWLHDLLVPLVHRVVVRDRHGEKRYGNKGDRVDADGLSAPLCRGELRAVYHGSPQRTTLKELTRSYQNLVEDTTRVMLRLKALFRARAIPTPGAGSIRSGTGRPGWRSSRSGACGFARRPCMPSSTCSAPCAPRPRTPCSPRHGGIRPGRCSGGSRFWAIRVALLLATMQTPWRFRTKRHLWAYAGLAVVTHSTADYALQRGRPVRRRRAPLTRGLNRHHNRILKDVFKGAATAATARPGPLQDFYRGMLARGMREELARVLVRDGPSPATPDAPGNGAGGSLTRFVRPACSPAEALA